MKETCKYCDIETGGCDNPDREWSFCFVKDGGSCPYFEAIPTVDPVSTTRDPKSSYYDAGGIEVQDFIEAKLTKDQYVGACMSNALKYLGRANYKGSFYRDLEKARNYLDYALGVLDES